MNNPIVDHTDTTALSALTYTPAKFAQPTAAWDDLTRIRSGAEEKLKLAVVLVREQFENAAGEDGGFDEVHRGLGTKE